VSNNKPFILDGSATVQAAADEVSVAPERRTISARLTTYDTLTHPQTAWGMPVRLADGSLEAPDPVTDVKLLQAHDPARVIGHMTEVEARDGALYGTFKLGRTQDAEDALMNAADGIIDAVSVGYRIHDAVLATVDDEDVVDVSSATLFEVSLVGNPGDRSARIESVTARKADPMPENTAVQAPETAPAVTPTMEQILAAVRAELAPAAAAPVISPDTVAAARAPQIITPDGLPVAFASRRPGRFPGAQGRDGKLYTAGDYFSAYARGVNEGDWERHNVIRAALSDEITSDVPGLLPQQIVGELLGRASGRRPLWDSLTSRDMPMVGEKFSRPRITQHVQVAVQTAQKTEVASRKYTVALDTVTKRTYSGALDVAQQALDWTSPSLLNELILDFTRIYVARTDAAAATDLVAAATTGAQTVTWDGTAATLTGVLAEAAGLVYSNAPEEADAFPNTIWLSVDMWVKLAGLTDTTGRPLLPQLGPMNAVGTIDLSDPENGLALPGFRTVVDKNLPDGTMIMGDREYTESYENGRRFLQAVRPDVLGLDIAYMGYIATYFPYPTTLVSITTTPPAEQAAAAKK
jgi:HK97 family phage prohead protease/HK97 family phage major capsid protein